VPGAFSPIAINGLEMENRFMRSATHDGSADDSGATTPTSIGIYDRLGKGRIGLIVSGYAFVSVHGQAFAGQYGAHTDEMIPGLANMARAVHACDGRIALQLVHAGFNSPYLKANGLWCLAPSKVDGSDSPHRELTPGEIEDIVRDFGSAAARAREAGFDAVQLHGAHGYLFSQFLSPLTNRRTDAWGGAAANRRRFHIEVIREIRAHVGKDFPLMMKFGLMDDEPGGLALEEGLATAEEMAAAGLDAIEVSAGLGGDFMQRVINQQANAGNERPWFRERARALKSSVSIPVMVVGGIRTLAMSESILESGEADMVSMSRPFVREPWLIRRWLSGDLSPAKCITCGRCFLIALGRRRGGESLCWHEYSKD